MIRYLGIKIMENISYYTDRLLLAVVLNQFEKIKEILESENYDKTLFTDIGGFEVPVPLQFLNECWRIILDHKFSETLEPIAQRNYENAVKINKLFKEHGISETNVPLNKIMYAVWNDEDESDDEVLDCSKQELIAKGNRTIDLDLYIAVCKMDFKNAEALLKKGADPSFTYEGSEVISICGSECSYQATCMAGNIIKSPAWYSNGIEIDELGNLLRWAANEKMYYLVNQYLKGN